MEREDWKLDTLCDLYETLTITQVSPSLRPYLASEARRVGWSVECDVLSARRKPATIQVSPTPPTPRVY